MLRINMRKGRYLLNAEISGSAGAINFLFLIDTGATCTYVSRQVLQILSNTELVDDNVLRGGIVPGVHRSFSKYVVDIHINTAHLTNVPVLIPNDAKICRPLLGIDVLSQLDISQLGNTYQLNVRAPKKAVADVTVTYDNADTCLYFILKSLHREDLYEQLLSLMPMWMEMSYEEFYEFVLKIIKEFHMT